MGNCVASNEALTVETKFKELQDEWKHKFEQNPLDRFKDEDFPADVSSILFPETHERSESKKDWEKRIRELTQEGRLQWLRPPEICEMNGTATAQLVVEGLQLADINQGYLGNCWMVAGLSHLAAKPDLFHDVVPAKDQDFHDNYAGIFRFRFWRFGKIVSCYVDDRLPCVVTDHGSGYTTANPIFCKNRRQPNEFWLPLLEKAYAKLNRSYEAITSGTATDIMTDLSGGVGYTVYVVPEHKSNSRHERDKLYFSMQRAMTMNTLMTASTPSKSRLDQKWKDLNISGSHAYTILKVDMVRDKKGDAHRLVKIRNPHGTVNTSTNPDRNTEWTGDWADGSDKWLNIDQERAKLMQSKDVEGVFWMAFSDFSQIFYKVDMCFVPVIAGGKTRHPRDVKMKTREWDVFEESGWWSKDLDSTGPFQSEDTAKGYWENPQFLREIKDPCTGDLDPSATLIISLLKVDYRKLVKADPDKEFQISFDVFQLKDNFDGKLSHENYQQHVTEDVMRHKQEAFREVRMWASVQPGRYVIIPSVSGMTLDHAEFIIRIFTETAGDVRRLQDHTGPGREVFWSKEYLVTQLFRKHAGHDGTLDAHELKSLLEEALLRSDQNTQPHSLELETCRLLLSVYDQDNVARLDLSETLKLWDRIQNWREKFLIYDTDRSGCISEPELKALFTVFKIKFSDKVMAAILKKYSGRKRVIYFNDFVQIMCKVMRHSQIAAESMMMKILEETRSFSADIGEKLVPDSKPFTSLTFDDYMCNAIMY